MVFEMAWTAKQKCSKSDDRRWEIVGAANKIADSIYTFDKVAEENVAVTVRDKLEIQVMCSWNSNELI